MAKFQAKLKDSPTDQLYQIAVEESPDDVNNLFSNFLDSVGG
jgi:hypothetical protein